MSWQVILEEFFVIYVVNLLAYWEHSKNHTLWVIKSKVCGCCRPLISPSNSLLTCRPAAKNRVTPAATWLISSTKHTPTDVGNSCHFVALWDWGTSRVFCLCLCDCHNYQLLDRVFIIAVNTCFPADQRQLQGCLCQYGQAVHIYVFWRKGSDVDLMGGEIF